MVLRGICLRLAGPRCCLLLRAVLLLSAVLLCSVCQFSVFLSPPCCHKPGACRLKCTPCSCMPCTGPAAGTSQNAAHRRHCCAPVRHAQDNRAGATNVCLAALLRAGLRAQWMAVPRMPQTASFMEWSSSSTQRCERWLVVDLALFVSSPARRTSRQRGPCCSRPAWALLGQAYCCAAAAPVGAACTAYKSSVAASGCPCCCSILCSAPTPAAAAPCHCLQEHLPAGTNVLSTKAGAWAQRPSAAAFGGGMRLFYIVCCEQRAFIVFCLEGATK